MKTLKFKQWTCELEFRKYENQRTAIVLVGTGQFEGEQIAVASVNLPDEPMNEDEIAIKDYSGNVGMIDFLASAGVINPTPVRYIESGYVSIPVCKLLKTSN